MVHTRAPGEVGAANSTADTAPKGAIVMDRPFGASIWSTLPIIAIAADAPAPAPSHTIHVERRKRVAASIGTDQCIYLHCDVADEGQGRSMVEHTVQTYGRLDIMFSNAGMINLTQTILDIDLEAMDRLFAVNVRGMVACVKYAGQAMVQGQIKGNIICTASVAATVGTEVRTDYTISKHAVLGLVRSASIQLGKHGIRVNCVSPYAVATPLLCGMLGMDAEAVEKKFSSIPKLQGVVLKVEHIADAVLFLATGESAFVSGHNLVVDGAFLAR
ncbi:short-chain dehydrogenase reductase 3b-like [Magnolia sinica]|uniref:short-chain dehydrogenase reductase 3b-like n=1 Tax=Magnolia sinica TaxID=86752 RepID=UPI002659A3FF|nr:short-chain dehydrogenase reductase 3b-like [Magnolia sinica]